MLRVALAGAGMVSKHHLVAWSRCDRAEIVAIADPSRENAELRASEFGIRAIYDGAAQMLDAERPDAFDIAAPLQVHGELVRIAAERGIHTLCQKPLAATPEEARATAAAAENRIRLMVHENWRFRPHYRQMLDWLRAGEIGEPRAFRLDTLGTSLVPPTEGATPPGLIRQPFLARMERLIVLELLVHQLDTLGCLLGPVSIRTATLDRISPHVIGEDTVTLHLDAGEANGVLFASWVARGQPPVISDGLYIVGAKGTIELHKKSLRLNTANGARDLNYDLEEGYQASYDNTIAHFVDCLATGKPFETPPEVHIRVLEAVETIYRLGGSSAQGDRR